MATALKYGESNTSKKDNLSSFHARNNRNFGRNSILPSYDGHDCFVRAFVQSQISDRMESDTMEKCYTTKSGIKIYAYPNMSQHSIFVSAFFKAGNMYETEFPCGISHFFEHIAIRNINKLEGGRLYQDLDRLGLEFNASTFSEMIQFYISGAAEHFSDAAEIISKIFSPIALDKSEIDRERMRIKAEMREGDDRNSLSSFSLSKIFSGTTLECSILGKNSELDKINLSTLCRYREKILTSNNIFFYLTGAVSDKDVEQLIEILDGYQLFDSLDERNNIAPVPIGFMNRAPAVHIKNSDYTMVRFNFDISMDKIASECLDLLYDILLSGYNSKIFIELSEKRGLIYDTVGGIDRYRNIGVFYFSFEIKDSKLYEAVEVVCEILQSLRRSCLSPEECMSAGFVDNAMMLYDDPRELNFTFAYDNHIMDMGYASVSERKGAYAAVTPEMIRSAADSIFRLENFTLTMKGSKKKTDTEKILSILKKYL